MSKKKTPANLAESRALARTKVALTRREINSQRLELMEEEILADALGTIESVLGFAKLDPEDPEAVPAAWADMEDDPLEERMRVARYALRTSAEVPFGVKAAFQVAEGVMRNRAKREGAKIMNVQTIHIPSPAGTYPKIELEDD